MAKPATASLEGKRVLVVEDDYFIAQDICDLLSDCRAEVIGPAARLQQGLDLVRDTERLDCAVLDLNLNGESVVEVARMLKSRRVAFVFVSGYDAGGIAEEFADAPRLVKPYDSSQLCRTVEKQIRENAG